MRLLRKLLRPLFDKGQNERFLFFVDQVEDFFAKILSLAMIGVILFAVLDLCIVLGQEVLSPPIGRFSTTLLKIFNITDRVEREQ